ncbi:splicing factor 3B subunit 4-like [Hydractinia symbiolongicarpus]|uniref:splicing factor 3B subunit 4-like n=1 Tax=Hydractinia symbiolongicarpus TaxID=13093 RepID=UPI00254D0853|nr:splicing factor 3B subunit 4-like [Hydractinia symbiolongicarpus]
MAAIQERNQDATVYCGNIDDKVLEALLWELFLQAGPVVNVHMPKDRITQNHQGYGFIEFMSEEDADYAIKVMNMIKVFGKPIRVNKASAHNKNLDVGANIFIGNLDPDIDEKLLYDTFSAFGVILQTPKIMRDSDTGNSKGFAFINFASFEASDAAIDAMNGQYLSNRPISVSYSFKKDAKGERHGSAAERLLAASNPLTQTDRPHQLFADAPRTASHMHDTTNRPPPGMHNVLPPPIVPPPMGMMPPMGMPGMNPGQRMPPNFPHGMPPGFMTHPPHMGMPPMPPMGFPPNMPPPGFMQPPPTSMQQQENAPPPPMPPTSDGSQRLPPPVPPPMPPGQMNSGDGPRGPPPRPPPNMQNNPFGERLPWGPPPPHGMMRGPPPPPAIRENTPRMGGFETRGMPPRPPIPPPPPMQRAPPPLQ